MPLSDSGGGCRVGFAAVLEGEGGGKGGRGERESSRERRRATSLARAFCLAHDCTEAALIRGEVDAGEPADSSGDPGRETLVRERTGLVPSSALMVVAVVPPS